MQFRGYQQQDAQEFIRYLLDRIHSELVFRKKLKSTLILNIFQGTLINQASLYIILVYIHNILILVIGSLLTLSSNIY